jgi:hypothetical protein
MRCEASTTVLFLGILWSQSHPRTLTRIGKKRMKTKRKHEKFAANLRQIRALRVRMCSMCSHALNSQPGSTLALRNASSPRLFAGASFLRCAIWKTDGQHETRAQTQQNAQTKVKNQKSTDLETRSKLLALHAHRPRVGGRSVAFVRENMGQKISKELEKARQEDAKELDFSNRNAKELPASIGTFI